MKIIATTGCGILVEMTPRELANITGRDYEEQLETRGQHTKSTGTEIGTTHEVSPAWKRLRRQEDVADKLEDVSKTLSLLAEIVTQTKVQFTNCTQEGSEGAR